jgi:hypothetical protein
MSQDRKTPPSDAQDEDEKDDALAGEGRGVSGMIPDVVRRAVLTGMGALFMGEESVRNLVGEMKLPKDALAFLSTQAEKTRAEVARVVTQEVRRFLESDTLQREVVKLLSSVTLEVSAQIKLKPSGEPDIKTEVRSGRPKDGEPAGEPVPEKQ